MTAITTHPMSSQAQCLVWLQRGRFFADGLEHALRRPKVRVGFDQKQSGEFLLGHTRSLDNSVRAHPRAIHSELMSYIYGINPVSEALKARGKAFEWVGVAKERHDLRLQRIIEDCRKIGVPVRFVQRIELDRMAKTG